MKKFHKGGVVKGPVKHGMLAGEGPAILSPRGRMVGFDLGAKVPESKGTYSFDVTVTEVNRENLRRFITEAWADLQTAMDEEGCGAFYAAVNEKLWEARL